MISIKKGVKARKETNPNIKPLNTILYLSLLLVFSHVSNNKKMNKSEDENIKYTKYFVFIRLDISVDMSISSGDDRQIDRNIIIGRLYF